MYPIVGFKARRLHPTRSPWVELSPSEWWREGVLVLHRSHHQFCRKARGQEVPVNGHLLSEARFASRLWSAEQYGQLILPVGVP
jgi:hypothetical protein